MLTPLVMLKRSWAPSRGTSRSLMNFGELRQNEVRRSSLPRTLVDDVLTRPPAKIGAWHPSVLSLIMVTALYTRQVRGGKVENRGPDDGSPVTQVRIARPTDRLEEVMRFYRDALGLEQIASFE